MEIKKPLKIFTLMLTIFLSLTILSSSVHSAWWDANWPYKIPINLSVSSGSTPSNYPVKIELNSTNIGSGWIWNNECYNNKSRVRFIDQTQTIELDYWVENCNPVSQKLIVWVEFDDTIITTDKTMWLYYGNLATNLKSNPEDTFDFFMNFSALTMNSEGAGQDISGGAVVSNYGTQLNTYGNSWKIWSGFGTINIDNTGSLRVDTQMISTDCGEISGISFDTDLIQSNLASYRWCGSQSSWGVSADYPYSGSGTWEDASIILNDFNMAVTYIHTPADDDADASVDTTYRNMRIRKYVSNEPVYSIGNMEVVNTTLANLFPNNASIQSNLNILFNCSAVTTNTTQLKNISLYGNWGGTWELKSTKPISGNINSTTFNITLPNTSGSYLWNCLVYDTDSFYDWYDENYTLIIDKTPPQITLNSPIGTIADVTPTINVSFSENVNAWYNINNSTNISLCNNCSSYDLDYLHLPEGNYFINIYAEDLQSNFNSSLNNNFTIDMVGNYYDNFNDNSSIDIYNDINWKKTNITYFGQGISYYNGIQIGYKSGNLNFIRNQWNGGANAGEIDIVCPGGDSNCWFVAPNGTNITNMNIDYGVATQDGASGTGFIMYSVQDVHTRFSPQPHPTNGDNFVGVCYSSGQWYYDDNNGCNKPFTPVSSDILIANASWGVASVFSLEGTAGGPSITNFTSKSIITKSNINTITNITWDEINTDSNNKISVQVSINNGITWYNATNGFPITNTSTNNSLIYKVIFDADGTKEFGIINMNISWLHGDITKPIINLTSPTNNSKLLGNGTIEFNFTITDNMPIVTCSFYLDNLLNKTWNCSTGINNSLNLTLNDGYHSWYIIAKDSSNNSQMSQNLSFLIINNYNLKSTKQIAYENTNIYKIKSIITNMINAFTNIFSLDFIDSKLNYGSFNVVPNITEIYAGQNVNGTNLIWNLTYASNDTQEINFSITGNTNKYNLKKQYLIGLD